MGGGQGGCERRNEVIVKMKKKVGRGGSRSGRDGGVQDGCERRIEVVVKMRQKSGVGVGRRGLVGSKVGGRG